MPRIETTIQGEWYWFCLFFEQMYRPHLTVRTIGKPRIYYVIPDMQGLTGKPPSATKTPDEVIEIRFNISRHISNMPDQGVYDLVALTFEGDMGSVRVLAEFEDPRDEEYTKRILGILLGAGQQAQKYKNEGAKIRAEQLIEHYYKMKEDGKNITLAKLAQSYSYNESYLRQAHIKYKRERSETAPNKKPNNGRRTGKKTT